MIHYDIYLIIPLFIHFFYGHVTRILQLTSKIFISSVSDLRSSCLMIDFQFSHPYWNFCITIWMQSFPNVVLFLVKLRQLFDTRAHIHTYIGPILKTMLLIASVFVIYIWCTTSKVIKLFNCPSFTLKLSHSCHEVCLVFRCYMSTAILQTVYSVMQKASKGK
jgi:hypothetical protein